MRRRAAEAAALRQARMIVEQELDARMEKQSVREKKRRPRELS